MFTIFRSLFFLAVEAAKEAFKTWGQTSVVERSEWLNKLGDALKKKQREMALCEMHDCGKTFGFAFHVY